MLHTPPQINNNSNYHSGMCLTGSQISPTGYQETSCLSKEQIALDNNVKYSPSEIRFVIGNDFITHRGNKTYWKAYTEDNRVILIPVFIY